MCFQHKNIKCLQIIYVVATICTIKVNKEKKNYEIFLIMMGEFNSLYSLSLYVIFCAMC